MRLISLSVGTGVAVLWSPSRYMALSVISMHEACYYTYDRAAAMWIFTVYQSLVRLQCNMAGFSSFAERL
jgi:hypothetical protein